jgi:subtilase family serine protease
MRKSTALVVSLISLTALLLASGGAAGGSAGNRPVRDHGRGHWFVRACGEPGWEFGTCGAQVVTNDTGTPLAASGAPAPGSYGPAQFHTAYGLPTTAPTAQTIAIVDAYDDPNIEADLATYDAYYGLPPCTTANGCFRKVNQTGGTTPPVSNPGWALEIALDVETAHQICQNCKILLVEASSATLSNLGVAENEAVALGANVISNSWGASEYIFEANDEAHYFNHPGVMITASSGDDGYGVEFPAASRYVTAVGGTTLSLNSDNTRNSEQAWSGSGSGCSAYIPKPSWQTDPSCSHRAVADVSADADPNTGAAVYDSVLYAGRSGWFQVGGTSLAAPLIAGAYALTGTASSATYGSTPYAHAGSLFDVTTGSNGGCTVAYLCASRVGYDGPTGLGTPIGLGAFTVGQAPPPPPPPPSDFTVGVSPSSVTVAPGVNATYTVSIGASGSFAGVVSLAQTGLSNGTFAPATVAGSGSSTLTVNTTGLSAGNYPFTISGTSGGTTHTVSATLVVQSGPPPPPPPGADFSIAVSPSSQTIARTSTSTYTVTITPSNGFASPVSLSASGYASGMSGAFTPNPASSTATFTVTAVNAGPKGRPSTALVRITGTSGTLTHSATLTLRLS